MPLSHPDYNSPSELKAVLDSNGFSMQKKFGQNFLINGDARKKIVDALDINENSFVWEVGPGLGSMTSEILNRGAKLTAFEIDKGFVSLISQYFKPYSDKGKFTLIEGDVLKTWKKQISCDEKKDPSSSDVTDCTKDRTPQNNSKLPDRFFGNLPYNIAATLIADTIENNFRFEKCVFTVQKEVAMRMAAKPGSDDYSSFSVLCNWAYDVKSFMDLSGSNFWPRPNVDSRCVLLTKKEDFPRCKNPSLFVKMQRGLFSSRRKTVRNNLSIFLKSNDMAIECLNEAGIDLMKRAEVLTIDELLKLSDVIDSKKK